MGESRGKKRRQRVAAKKRVGGNPLKTLAFLPDTKADHETPAEALATLEADLEKQTGRKPKGLPAALKSAVKGHAKATARKEDGAPAHARNAKKRQADKKHGKHS